MNSSNLATVKPKIQAGVSLREARKIGSLFLSKYVESFRLDVDVIICSICNMSSLDLITRGDYLLSNGEAAKLGYALWRRSLGEPIAYIIGEKEFFGLTFEVCKDVLIPRPDSELLVEAALKFINARSLQVIDVCTGSGCIALAIAKNSSCSVVGIDISEQALNVACRNAKNLDLCDAVEFRQGNLLSDFGSDRVDLIVANPPYVLPSEMNNLMRDVKEFEPHLALVGQDEDGLGLHRELLFQSFDRLLPNGKLMMEIGHNQAHLLSEVAFPGFSKPEFLRDYVGVLRVVVYSRLPSKNEEIDNG